MNRRTTPFATAARKRSPAPSHAAQTSSAPQRHTIIPTYPFAEWEHVVLDLDQLPCELPGKAADFIIHLREDPPLRLTEAQVEWLRDLQRQYLE